MKRIYLLLALLLLSGVVAVTARSCSLSRPEQLNLILRVDGNVPSSLTQVVSGMADRTGMKVESQDFNFGGKNGVLKTVSVYGGGTDVMIQGTSDEECHPLQGRRDPTFSRPVYAVSIYRTWSLFGPKMALKDVAAVLGEEAKRRGGALVPESQNCVESVPGMPRSTAK
jgi:hypothetical protein